MNLNKAIELSKAGHWQDAQVRVSPGNLNQWFVMLRDKRNKSFVLTDDNDDPIATEEMTRISEYIRAIGLKEFTVYL